MIRTIISGLAVAMLLGAAGAQAQVSREAYPQYFDYIMDHDWYCLTRQPFNEVDSGEMQTNVEFRFDRDTSWGAYRFKGNGTQVLTVGGRDYHSQFRMEGFGVNESGFGTGISIVKLTVTGGDPLPNGWTWNGGEHIQLQLVSDKPGSAYPYTLQGYETGGSLTFDCIVDG